MQNHYPLWKNLLLLGILLIGIIYALPNLFSDDPSIQISPTSNAASSEVNEQVVTKVKQILSDAHFNYIKIDQHPESLLVRFSDTDVQIQARDILKAALGDDYNVALNLASRTPHWLTALGAQPMKLGLDLRGGVNFLLEVDTDTLIEKREEGDIRSISDTLRQANIRYAGIERIRPHGMMIRFRDAKALENAQSELKSHLSDYTITRPAAENGSNEYKLQAVMSDAAAQKIASEALDQTANTLRNRVNELGVSEAIVQRQGANHISVDLPGIQDTARAKEMVGKVATLRFQMVDVEHDAESAAMSGDTPLGTRLYSYEGRHILLKDQVILQGNSVTYAAPSFSQDGRPAVTVHLGGGGESLFHRATSENIGKPMAVVYVETKPEQHLVEGKVVNSTRQEERLISVATIQSALGNNFEITGLGTQKYASDLALLLRSGALVAPLTFVQEITVGPSMGKANIHMGLISVTIGFVFVALFMLIYYYFFGLLADMALFLNLIFIVAVLSLLGSTLTLPGIAGIVLTVGMAVDSNVLIYERIREELRNGVSPQASIYTGYARVFTTIVDSNVTTLIVAVVLFALGSGPVKGFAVTLTVGILTSMLTAIMFTRAVVNLVYGRRAQIKKLSIGI